MKSTKRKESDAAKYNRIARKINLHRNATWAELRWYQSEFFRRAKIASPRGPISVTVPA